VPYLTSQRNMRCRLILTRDSYLSFRYSTLRTNKLSIELTVHIREIKSELDIERILLELSILPEFQRQICLQGVEGSSDYFLGCGTTGSQNSWERKQIHSHKTIDFKYPLFHLPYINQFINENQMTHTRVMKLLPRTCYSYHKDWTKRIHIPVTTNEHCWVVVNKEMSHLPANGSYFVVDTTQMHTAVNASSEERIHILGNIT